MPVWVCMVHGGTLRVPPHEQRYLGGHSCSDRCFLEFFQRQCPRLALCGTEFGLQGFEVNISSHDALGARVHSSQETLGSLDQAAGF